MTVSIPVGENKELNHAEVERYSRHLLLPEFGLAGQQALKASRVLLIGSGGLGSPCALYLAAAGIGTIGLIDFDVVEESNLQRQVIHTVADVGRKKVESARDSILAINPNISVELFDAPLNKDNALEIISQFDLVLDGTDNFPTRYLVNDACVIAGKPYIWGSIFRFEGQVSVFWEQAPDGKGYNYRDLYPEPPPPEHAPSCSEGGVLGVLCAAIGSIMSTEAIKLIAGIGEPLLGKFLLYDALEMTYKKFAIHKAANRVVPTKLVDYEFFCGAGKAAETPAAVPTMTVQELQKQFDENPSLKLLDVREATELDIVKLKSALHFPKSKLDLSAFENSFSKHDDLVVMCKMGGRSRQVVELLIEEGFSNVKNLEGGILKWIQEIEPELPVY